MATQQESWQGRLNELKSAIRPAYDNNLKLFTAILFSKERSLSELERNIPMLEPAINGGDLLHTIQIPSPNCRTLALLYFGRDRSGLDLLQRGLHGIQSVIDELPSELRPSMSVPRFDNQLDRTLAAWTAFAYWVTWECDEIYLQAELEFLQFLNGLPFLPWIECPQPDKCEPRSWMLLQADRDDRLAHAAELFTSSGHKWPDLINWYLLDDFIFSSTIAIDLLLHRLPESLEESSTDGDKARAQKNKRKKALRRNVTFDVDTLITFLMVKHLGRGQLEEPMSQQEIADHFGWSKAKVSRRMRSIFEGGGMTRYKNVFKAGNPASNLRRELSEAKSRFEPVAPEEENEDDEDE